MGLYIDRKFTPSCHNNEHAFTKCANVSVSHAALVFIPNSADASFEEV